MKDKPDRDYRDLSKPKNVSWLLFIGNYAKWRRLDVLLDAFKLVNNKFFNLIIVGGGWQKMIYKFRKKNKTLSSLIIYLGKVPHTYLPKIYGLCDIYIQPHDHFGMGRTMIEAMQSSLPIIATGEPRYYPELIDGFDFMVVPPNNPKELAKSIKRMLEPIGVYIYTG